MDLASTNFVQNINQQMGVVIATNPRLVADLLEANQVVLDLENALNPIELTDAYLENIPNNDSLKLGSAYLVNRFEDSSFDGEVDNDAIKDYYEALDDYWGDENYSYLDPVTAVASALGSGANLGKSIVEAKDKKRYFGSDLAEKKSQSREQIIQGIMAKKQQDAEIKKKELDAKTQKMVIIASVVGVFLVLGTIVILRMKKNG